MRELRAISPGKLGYGCDLPSIERALARDPHYIAIDAGTTDIGAYYLGTGEPFYAPSSIKRDLVPLMRAAHQRKIPLIVGNMVATARNDQLAFGMSIVREVAREEGMELRVAVIPAEIDRAELLRRNSAHALEPLGARAPLTKAEIEESAAIVGQMGVEPIVRALDAGADMVVCGRACDDVLFAAVPVREGYDQGLALHMGKILECGAVAFEPGSLHASAIGYLRDDHFVLEAADPERKATVQSVASHTLYERSDPYLQAGPGGINDLSDSRFEQLDERRVKISGSRWVEAERYLVKLEGARHIGFRSICMTGIRDPILIEQLDDVLAAAEKKTRERFAGEGALQIIFRQYGRNAVMGDLEPTPIAGHEIGLFTEVIAETQALADASCMFVRGTLQHADYPRILATAGNLAYPISPFTVPCGSVYTFHIDHLLPVADPCELFPFEIERVGRIVAPV
jgi:hypothetical protein